MARSSVDIILGQGQTGQLPANNDYISGIIFYGTAPSTFAVTPTQAVFSVADAEAKGILNDFNDATGAQGRFLITSGAGGAGETCTFKVTVPKPNGTSTIVTICSYTTVSGDTVVDTLGANLTAAINAGTYSHGFSASYSTLSDTITITAPKKYGISLNSGSPLAFTTSGTTAGTITQFGSGTLSNQAIWHYQISEYFRQAGNSKLWVNFTSTPSSTFAEVVTLAQAANGECRQIAVLDPTATSVSTFTSNMTLLNTQAVSLFGAFTPAIVLYAPNIKAVSDLSTLENQQQHTNNYVSPVIVQDGNAVGANLFVVSGISIPAVGCVLGCVSKAAVSQDIGEIGAFNITNDVELAMPAISNGTLVSALASSLLDTLDSYRYIFATGIANYAGTYLNNDWSAIAQTSDYNRISRNRTIQKATRQLYTAVIPLLKSRLYVNTDGTLTELTIQQFKGAALPYMNQMVADGDVSAVAITINPAQNVISTNKIIIGVKIVPVGIADFIEIQLGFAVKI
jgi:hypothetical protein